MFSQIKDIKHINKDFHSVTWVMPQLWDLGELGGQKFNFSKHAMVMWHIKLKGMVSRTGYKLKFSPDGQTGNLRVGSKGQISLNPFESEGICDGVPTTVHSSCFCEYYVSLRKPVFGVRNNKGTDHLISTFVTCIRFLKSIVYKLATSKLPIF